MEKERVRYPAGAEGRDFKIVLGKIRDIRAEPGSRASVNAVRVYDVELADGQVMRAVKPEQLAPRAKRQSLASRFYSTLRFMSKRVGSVFAATEKVFDLSGNPLTVGAKGELGNCGVGGRR